MFKNLLYFLKKQAHKNPDMKKYSISRALPLVNKLNSMSSSVFMEIEWSQHTSINWEH